MALAKSSTRLANHSAAPRVMSGLLIIMSISIADGGRGEGMRERGGFSYAVACHTMKFYSTLTHALLVHPSNTKPLACYGDAYPIRMFLMHQHWCKIPMHKFCGT